MRRIGQRQVYQVSPLTRSIQVGYGISMRRLAGLLLGALVALAACETTIPTAPPITVIITAVDDTTALSQGVREALAATDQANIGLTETVFAQGGITLTPSDTPTLTLSPTVTPTRFVTATPTAVPSPTTTATFAPYPTNLPVNSGSESNGWIRVIHGWREVGTDNVTNPVDVYLGDDRIARSLTVGGQTNYYAVSDTAQISLRQVDSEENEIIAPQLPIISSAVQVPRGGVVSVVAMNAGEEVVLLPINEDPTPLASGMARMTVVQANPRLIPVNALLPLAGRALAYNLQPGQVVGPFDLPAGIYPVQLNDAEKPELTVFPFLNDLRFTSRASYILVLLPGGVSSPDLTDFILFSGITRRIDTELSARFINLTSGAVTVLLDGQEALEGFLPGDISEPLPISRDGASLRVNNSQYFLLDSRLGPWSTTEERRSDKIILLTDGTKRAAYTEVVATALSQSAQPSVINASLRLVHALPNTQPLTLQIRPVRVSVQLDNRATPQPLLLSEAENPWITIGQEVERVGLASPYVGRAPDLYDVRAVYSGTRTTIGEVNNIRLLAGGIYDFVAMPGTETGSVQLTLVQPSVQITGLVSGEGIATAVFESVEATLTAMAPRSTETPTRAVTPTTTRTPVPTNTPRPSNTPSIFAPSLTVDPAPPNATGDIVTLIGQNFSPGSTFRVSMDGNGAVIASGQVNNNGGFSISIPAAGTWNPGPHTLNVCVDCEPGGPGQPVYLVFIVAEPDLTATVEP